MPNIIETSWGYVVFETNELSVISTVADPPKVRLASPEGLSIGAFSFNRMVNGTQREMVLFQGKQDERTRHLPPDDPRSWAGEFTIHVNNGGGNDENMRRILEARHDGVVFDVPIRVQGRLI